MRPPLLQLQVLLLQPLLGEAPQQAGLVLKQAVMQKQVGAVMQWGYWWSSLLLPWVCYDQAAPLHHHQSRWHCPAEASCTTGMKL
jgi:hypothetical protein